MRRVRSPAGGLRRIREATHAAPARARRGIAKQSAAASAFVCVNVVVATTFHRRIGGRRRRQRDAASDEVTP